MAVRLKEWMIPYTWGIWIEITDNHVINVLLRAMNNLIMVNEDRELYVDLQLPDWIEPDADFPVWVTTGRILEEDWRPQNATILNWKTTSGDYVRLIYAADDKLYYDPWTWEWRLLATYEMIEDLTIDANVKRFKVTDLDWDADVWQAMVDWYLDWKYPIIEYEWGSYILESRPQSNRLRFYDMHTVINNHMPDGFSNTTRKVIYATWDASTNEFIEWLDDEINIIPDVIAKGIDYQVPYTPQYDGSPATKKYVDDGLATKQDILIAWANISIAADGKTISATLPSALVYKGNVSTINDLPSSWQTVWDTYFVEWVDWMYSWDWTQWNYVGSTSPSLTNYFNKTVDDSDDITEWSIHLFCSSTEKNYWNSKQDALIAWANIQISNNVISATDTTYIAWTAMELVWTTFNNTKPFDPENTWVLSQVLKKTSTWYRWANETGWFDPENAGTTGQVLKKTGTGYAWANESWWGGGWWGSYTAWNGISISSSNVISNTKPFEPSPWWTTWQVLTKTADGYAWQTIAAGEWNVKWFSIDFSSYTQEDLQEIVAWVNQSQDHIAIVKNETTSDVYIYSSVRSSSWALIYEFQWVLYFTDNSNDWNWDYTTLYNHAITITLENSTYTLASVAYNAIANFLKVSNSGYVNTYMPTQAYQPATKGYVDSRDWTWTLSEYNALQSIDPDVVYNITSLS